jgi:hypothetical protein
VAFQGSVRAHAKTAGASNMLTNPAVRSAMICRI